jgi:2-iminoacetate synthase ThiH
VPDRRVLAFLGRILRAAEITHLIRIAGPGPVERDGFYNVVSQPA